MSKQKAVVVLSGGQDSTTCLFHALAQENQEVVLAVTFDYGQRHKIEIYSAIKIAQMAGVPHEIIKLGDQILKGTSPLTDPNAELEQYADYNSLPGGLEKTFVPMRNQLFLTIAANRAAVLGASVLYTGVCEEDYGGYPDCRRQFIDVLMHASRLGTFTGEGGMPNHFYISTPLMYKTKAQTVEMAVELPGCMEALAYSHTAYDGAYPPIGKDHATLLRAKGFAEAGIPDPLILRAVYVDGLMPLPDEPNYSPDLVDKWLRLLAPTFGISNVAEFGTTDEGGQ